MENELTNMLIEFFNMMPPYNLNLIYIQVVKRVEHYLDVITILKSIK